MLTCPIVAFCNVSYTVDFRGLENPEALKAIKLTSQLVVLQSRPPSSASTLRFRAESDIPLLIRVLHAYGYYEAKVHTQILEHLGSYHVEVEISPGPLYTLDAYLIQMKTKENEPVPQIKLEDLGLTQGQPALSQSILDAEAQALRLLSECGYPLAHIHNRSVIADGKSKTVRVELELETGPFCRFGSTQIHGISSVKEALINQKIAWQRGSIYNSELVSKTQKSIMDTGLFSFAAILNGDQVDDQGQLPMDIELTESKHKSVSLGASYQKTFGLGGTIGWENRNVCGMGRKFSLQADVTQRSHSGAATYLIPDAWRVGQDLIFQAEAARESIVAYHDQSYQLQCRLDWQLTQRLFFSVGTRAAFILVSSSVDNGNFLLLEAPLKLRWSSVSDFLNPTQGYTVDWRLSPSVNIKDISNYYTVQQVSLATYFPLIKKENLILAQKATIGTIFSNGLNAVPVPRRLFGGCEENLRGYKYLTVSPLDKENKPTGGRLAFFYSLEARMRVADFGIVPFFDLGNVGRDPGLSFKNRWRKSVGIGLRYFSFAGPLRLDFAFPLDRREHLDPTWWIFVSIGQAF